MVTSKPENGPNGRYGTRTNGKPYWPPYEIFSATNDFSRCMRETVREDVPLNRCLMNMTFGMRRTYGGGGGGDDGSSTGLGGTPAVRV